MAKPVELLDEARRDFDESFDWYSQRSQAAAREFAFEFERLLERILSEPDRFPLTQPNCRYGVMRRYPFRIVFRDEAQRIVVIAVAHAKRRPDYWRKRT